VFEQTSANGILLFRQISSILCTYGSRILAVPVQTDIYKEKYKGVRLMLNALVAALSGNYVNFGVFGLYQDDVRTCWIVLFDTTYCLLSCCLYVRPWNEFWMFRCSCVSRSPLMMSWRTLSFRELSLGSWRYCSAAIWTSCVLWTR
jgi:hypothetical protein